ncbi:MAG: hypothetical protein ACJATI_005586, partial [Halioglobus sp.]
MNIDAQCTDNIVSYKVYSESFGSSGTVTLNSSTTNPILIQTLSDLRLKNVTLPDGTSGTSLCTVYASMEDEPPQLSTNTIDVTQGNLSARRQEMVFFHISAARNFALANFPSTAVSGLDGNLKFKVEDLGEPQFMVDDAGGTVNIDYRKRDEMDGGGDPYKAFSEDAFAIASGYFQAAHQQSLTMNMSLAKELPANEGVQFAISDYLSYRYMSSMGFASGTVMYTRAGDGSMEWSTLDIDYSKINYNYFDYIFQEEMSSQQQSELLSAVLYYLSNDVDNGVGDDIVDAMVVNAMVNLNNNTVENQGDAAQILYAQALENGLGTDDLCKIINFFTIVYGDDFRD